MITPEQFRAILASPESSRIEFKSAGGGFHFEELARYCVALANEGGGKIILGVTDKRPRKIIGTKAFPEPGRTEAELFERLRQRISIEEYLQEGKRVLIINIPGRLPGTALQYKGAYLIEIVSPGGFPPGITPDNVLWQQNPRNRRVAEVLSKCGLVERAGQGFDLIFRECIRQSKPLPDFSRTDAHFVWLTLHGQIQDPEFLRFLEEIGHEKMADFSTEDFLVVDLVHREKQVPGYLKSRVQYLLDQGIIERLGRGRGARMLLSQSFYRHLGKAGVYTRKRGLDQETNKALLLKHIADRVKEGAAFNEFIQVLPHLTRRQIQYLVTKLKQDGLVVLKGTRKGSRYHRFRDEPHNGFGAESE